VKTTVLDGVRHLKKWLRAGDDKLLDARIFELESDRKEWKW
jgi:hypothetical protein